MSEKTHMDDPTLASVFERMLARDKDDREHWIQIASKLGNQSVVLESMKNEMGRLASLAEEQAQYNRELLILMQKTGEHGRTFERAFGDIEKERNNREELGRELTKALKELTGALHSYNGSVRALKWIVATMLPIGILLSGFAYNTLADRIAEVRLQHEQDISAATAAREKLRDQVTELQRTRPIP